MENKINDSWVFFVGMLASVINNNICSFYHPFKETRTNTIQETIDRIGNIILPIQEGTSLTRWHYAAGVGRTASELPTSEHSY